MMLRSAGVAESDETGPRHGSERVAVAGAGGARRNIGGEIRRSMQATWKSMAMSCSMGSVEQPC